MTLYRIRFLYCLTVEASSKEEAFKAVCQQVKDHPHSVISAVEDDRYANRRPLWKRLAFGR